MLNASALTSRVPRPLGLGAALEEPFDPVAAAAPGGIAFVRIPFAS
jgi:hypothetical protein